MEDWEAEADLEMSSWGNEEEDEDYEEEGDHNWSLFDAEEDDDEEDDKNEQQPRFGDREETEDKHEVSFSGDGGDEETLFSGSGEDEVVLVSGEDGSGSGDEEDDGSAGIRNFMGIVKVTFFFVVDNIRQKYLFWFCEKFKLNCLDFFSV